MKNQIFKIRLPLCVSRNEYFYFSQGYVMLLKTLVAIMLQGKISVLHSQEIFLTLTSVSF